MMFHGSASIRHRRGSANPYRPVVQTDMRALPFRDGVFAAVTHLWCLDHLPDPLEAITEAARVLRPGGRYFACSSARDNDPEVMYERYPRSSFDAEEAADIVAAIYDDVQVERWDHRTQRQARSPRGQTDLGAGRPSCARTRLGRELTVRTPCQRLCKDAWLGRPSATHVSHPVIMTLCASQLGDSRRDRPRHCPGGTHQDLLTSGGTTLRGAAARTTETQISCSMLNTPLT